MLPVKAEETTEAPQGTKFVTYHSSVNVAPGTTFDFQPGEVVIQGDFANQGTVNAKHSTVVFDGADQTLTGNLAAAKVVLRGGVKRLRGSFSAPGTGGRNAEPGQAGLYVEAGTTLIIEKDGKWTATNPYSFQVAGRLIIDGGTFSCSFSNGNGTDRGEKSWLPGSELTIRSGSFIGSGDADFSGATITIHDGSLEINDDIWSLGDSLTMYGGLLRNSKHGGMFHVSGDLNIHGGEVQINQNGSRSLRLAAGGSIYSTAGTVVISGSAARGDNGAILLNASAVLPNLQVNTSVRIHKDSASSAYLSVGGELSIGKGQKFEAAGFHVVANFYPSADQGQFIP